MRQLELIVMSLARATKEYVIFKVFLIYFFEFEKWFQPNWIGSPYTACWIKVSLLIRGSKKYVIF